MRKKWVIGFLLGLGAAALAVAPGLLGGLDRLENVTWSWRVRLMARPGPNTPRVRVILLDQNSLDWGLREMKLPWPWPREVYAPLLDFCKRGGARAVAFDVLFTEPSYMGVSDDEILGEAITRSVPFAGALALPRTETKTVTWPADVPAYRPVIEGFESAAAALRPAGLRARHAAFPNQDLKTRAKLLGNVSDFPDADGTFRRVTLLRVFDGVPVFSLGLAPYLAEQRAAGREPSIRMQRQTLWIDDRPIPFDRHCKTILRYRGPTDTFPTVSAAAVIQSEMRLQEGGEQKPTVDPSFFKDAYVFFGFSAPGLLDLRPTPVSRVSPGVEIHATLLDNFLSTDAFRELPGLWAAACTLLLALAAALAVVYSRRVWHNAAAFILFPALPVFGSVAAYAAGWWAPVVMPFLAVAVALMAAVLYQYATEGRQKAFLKHAFRQYLGPEVIEQIIADPSRLTLGGERRELTIFFSDIEKFSSFSERLDPPTLTALLNDFLTEMGAIIQEEGGYLDKFIGDAIVAFWNAPLEQPDHAARALRAARRCQQAIAAHRDEWDKKYGAVIRMRIGLHTGEVNVGNMGSRERFNYTVLGDAANLASRLEGANKAFGTYTMASETTWQAAGGGQAGRELGRLRVVGRAAPVRVFEPFGEADAPPAPEAFAAGLEAFYAGRFDDAAAAFRALAEQDVVAARYAARCDALAAHPPTAWDGVWSLTEK